MKQELISSATVFKISLTFNLISVIWNIIGDCDETYNYWEPLHFLLYNKGFQTWEYSPQYALRSYFFLIIYGWPAIFLKYLFPSISKYVLFYVIRIYLIIIISLIEVYLYKGLRNSFKNDFVAIYCILFFILSSGSFISISSFLPSSFAMFCSMFAIAAWLSGNYNGVVSSIALSAIIGWPFSVAIGIPFAIDIVFIKRKLINFLKSAIIWGAIFLSSSVLCDSLFYGSFTFPALNIVKYNVFNSNGSELYGTESAAFYVKNYLLNFNICVGLSALLFLIVIGKIVFNPLSCGKMRVEIMTLSVLIVWNVIFFCQPHKEERFLFPCYPFLCISSGICLSKIQLCLSQILNAIKRKLKFTKIIKAEFLSFFVLFVYGLINLSRIISVVMSFNSSTSIYYQLNEVKLSEDKMLCLGREWHRFPSSFFLTLPQLDVSFIKSEFKGQLPSKFQSLGNIYPTKVNHKHFNDLNEEETDRYLHLSNCHYIIDRVDPVSQSVYEPNWETLISSHWTRMVTLKMLSPSAVGNKMSIFRSFYVPFFYERMNNFVDYVLLERV